MKCEGMKRSCCWRGGGGGGGGGGSSNNHSGVVLRLIEIVFVMKAVAIAEKSVSWHNWIKYL